MEIAKNLENIKNTLPSGVKMVAVSKTKSEEEIMQVYNAGHKIFGENKVQELTRKHNNLPADIEWHMIGHLQRNKVKYIAPFVSLIQSVDSLKLLNEINKEAVKNERIQPCLFQVHIAEEETKFGFYKEELISVLESNAYTFLKNIEIQGLMGMATYTENTEQIRSEFRSLHDFFQLVKQTYFKNNTTFIQLSMGMSDDYKVAIDEGSTIIRVGSLIFGKRNYVNKNN